MKYIYLFAAQFLFFYAQSQIMQFGDTVNTKAENLEGEFLTDNTKLANFKYHNYLLSENTDVDIYAQKFTEMRTRSSTYGIEINGHISRAVGLTSNTEFVSGNIVEAEIDNAIHALQYIKDSLLTTTPTHEIFYVMNFKQSKIKISAYYNLNDKTDWAVALWLDRYRNSSELNIKPKDVADLLKVFNTGKEKIKAMK